MKRVAPWLIDLIRESGTPHFIFDLHIIREQIDNFQRLLPGVTPFYSTKTCSTPAVIDTCIQKGLKFDAATIQEIELLLDRGAKPDDILYTHPIKSPGEIQKAYLVGVRRFTCDNIAELIKIHTSAPHAEIFVRFSPPKDASLYNYRQRLGAAPKELKQLLEYALHQELAIHGISFMVGSQSMRVDPWVKTLRQVRKVVKKYYQSMPTLRQINIGAGFPVAYAFNKTPNLEAVASHVMKELAKFPADFTFLAEPGRIIVAPAAFLAISVVEKVRRGKTNWLFTDTSVYNALIERIESGGKFRYSISGSTEAGSREAYDIAGKTLDPDDIVGSNVELSSELQAGDLLFVHDVGAYTVEFATAYHALPRPLLSFYDSQYDRNVTVTKSAAGRGVHAKKSIPENQVLFTVTGHKSNKRSRTSFQIDADTHMEPNIFGAYLNHSCEPNAGIRTNFEGLLDVVARRQIKPGEEVTVDYAMFEYELADMAKVACLCDSPGCRGAILGYKHLSQNKKNEYKNYIASHLLSGPDTPEMP